MLRQKYGYNCCVPGTRDWGKNNGGGFFHFAFMRLRADQLTFQSTFRRKNASSGATLFVYSTFGLGVVNSAEPAIDWLQYTAGISDCTHYCTQYLHGIYMDWCRNLGFSAFDYPGRFLRVTIVGNSEYRAEARSICPSSLTPPFVSIVFNICYCLITS